MAVTSPDNIFYPTLGDQYNVVQDMATLAQSVQDAITSSKSLLVGTSAERASAVTFEGLEFYETDTQSRWLFRAGTWGLYGFGPFKSTYIGNDNSVTVSSTTWSAPAGLNISATVAPAVACRAKITVQFQGYVNAVNSAFSVSARLSGATSFTPIAGADPRVARVTSVSSTIQPLTISRSWIHSLNPGATTIAMWAVAEGGGGGTRTLRGASLLIEPVSE